jgi:carbamate kinase
MSTRRLRMALSAAIGRGAGYRPPLSHQGRRPYDRVVLPENGRIGAPSPSTVLVALGGHAFMRPGDGGTHEDHLRNASSICEVLMTLLERGYRLVLTHGNGPQVGALLEREQRFEALPPAPLDVLVAQTEGSLGYYLQQELLNAQQRRGLKRFVVTVVTQVVVDPDDPAFARPTKPVGPFLTAQEARRRAAGRGWSVGEDAGRGWRRLVPSPMPREVVQHAMIREAAAQGHVVIAAGGGGIPVRRGADGTLLGVEAVIDKDRTSGVLAREIGADLLIILTSVDRVYLHYGRDGQVGLGAVTLSDCARYMAEGHFPPGSMGPKVEAIHEFLRGGGRRGLITSPPMLAAALDGEAGTHFVGRL